MAFKCTVYLRFTISLFSGFLFEIQRKKQVPLLIMNRENVICRILKLI